MSGNSWPGALFPQTAQRKEKKKKSPPGGLAGIRYTGLSSQGEVLSTEGSFGDAGVDSWLCFKKTRPLYSPDPLLSTPSVSVCWPRVKLGMNEVTLWAHRLCGKKKKTASAGQTVELR